MTGIQILNALGDIGLLLSLALALFAWNLSTRPRAALWFAVAVVMCGGATTILKIYLRACPIIPLLRGPSGHVSFATLVYGALIVVFAPRAPAWARLPLVVAGAALIALIAIARYVVEAHDLAEIGFGLAIGLVSLAVFVLADRDRNAGERSVKPLAFAAGAIVVGVYGHQFNGEVFVNFAGFGGETAHLAVAGLCPAESRERAVGPAGMDRGG